MLQNPGCSGVRSPCPSLPFPPPPLRPAPPRPAGADGGCSWPPWQGAPGHREGVQGWCWEPRGGPPPGEAWWWGCSRGSSPPRCGAGRLPRMSLWLKTFTVSGQLLKCKLQQHRRTIRWSRLKNSVTINNQHKLQYHYLNSRENKRTSVYLKPQSHWSDARSLYVAP